tara:strand:+ start:334 stop:627 length:294 start_codon:yes stop_codon:yes gene_type:complete
MKLYKTSYFREIKEIEVISFNTETYDIKLSDIRPEYKLGRKWKLEDRVITRKRNKSQTNYHETLNEAKEFVRKQLNMKIKKLESDLIKFKDILSDFG